MFDKPLFFQSQLYGTKATSHYTKEQMINADEYERKVIRYGHNNLLEDYVANPVCVCMDEFIAKELVEILNKKVKKVKKKGGSSK